MKVINRRLYYPHCQQDKLAEEQAERDRLTAALREAPAYTTDTFVEVPDEVAAAMEECRLYENRQEGRKSYYHVYSMDCSPGIENLAMFLVQSPEDLIFRDIDEAADEGRSAARCTIWTAKASASQTVKGNINREIAADNKLL